MDILISRENALSISLVPRKKNYEDYSALSLTAGNYSANPCNFNLLPEGLLGDRKLRQLYDDFIAKVNTSKEIGVMNQFPPTLYFFVPHTKGDEQIDGLLLDLFNALHANNAQEVLLTHWMLISEKPSDIEFDGLIHFIKHNLTTDIKRIYLRIDEKFRSDFIQRFNQ